MAWRGSLSRSLMSTARASTFRSSPPLSAPRRLRPPPGLNSRRLSFSNPSTLGELGCAQSLLPLHRMVAAAPLTSHLAVNVRAFCELSHGVDTINVLTRENIFECNLYLIILGPKSRCSNIGLG